MDGGVVRELQEQRLVTDRVAQRRGGSRSRRRSSGCGWRPQALRHPACRSGCTASGSGRSSESSALRERQLVVEDCARFVCEGPVCRRHGKRGQGSPRRRRRSVRRGGRSSSESGGPSTFSDGRRRRSRRPRSRHDAVDRGPVVERAVGLDVADPPVLGPGEDPERRDLLGDLVAQRLRIDLDLAPAESLAVEVGDVCADTLMRRTASAQTARIVSASPA